MKKRVGITSLTRIGLDSVDSAKLTLVISRYWVNSGRVDRVVESTESRPILPNLALKHGTRCVLGAAAAVPVMTRSSRAWSRFRTMEQSPLTLY